MKEKHSTNVSADRMYLLIKTIRDKAKISDEKTRHNLKCQAKILNRLFCWGYDKTLLYYKNSMEVKENGNKSRTVKKNKD